MIKYQINDRVVAPVLMLSAAMQFSVMNFCIKLLSSDFSIWHISFFRFFGGLVILLALFGRNKNPFKGHQHKLLVMRGLFGSIAFLLIVYAIRILPLSSAMVIVYTYPAFAAIFSVWLYGDSIRISQLFMIILVLSGAFVLFGFKGGNLLGEILATVAAGLFGLTVTLIRSLRQKNGPVIIYLYFCTMGALISLPNYMKDPLIPVTPHQWFIVICLVGFSVSAQLAMNQGFFYCKSYEGGIYMTMDAVFTVLAGVVFLSEKMTWQLLTGGCMILSGIIAMNLLCPKKDSNTNKPKNGSGNYSDDSDQALLKQQTNLS